jgi:undecaprenyl-diphosphatase
VRRFWPTGYALAPAQAADGAAPTPIWVGSLVHERLRRASWPFNMLVTYAGSHDSAGPELAAPGQPTNWRAITMPGSEGCEGRSVMLIVSGGH